MDGAIIVNPTLTKIAYANVQLMPDPTIPSNETGTRHRTAERVAKQTGALVVSISQQRSTISVYVGQARYQLDPCRRCSRRRTRRSRRSRPTAQRLDQVLTRLTALEFQNAVVLDDVLVVLQRAEMTTRMAAEIERDCVELGAEARLIRMQLHELVGEVPVERQPSCTTTTQTAPARARSSRSRAARASVPAAPRVGAHRELLGYPADINPLDHSVSPRGYRILVAHPAPARSRS
jgi:diadenylate cyclase